jgi:hypothetical protein
LLAFAAELELDHSAQLRLKHWWAGHVRQLVDENPEMRRAAAPGVVLLN